MNPACQTCTHACAHTYSAHKHQLSFSTNLSPTSQFPTPSSGEQAQPLTLLPHRWQSSDAEAAPASRPWFYPVVEQHDVTYHRVKPLAGHREMQATGALPTASSSITGK